MSARWIQVVFLQKAHLKKQTQKTHILCGTRWQICCVHIKDFILNVVFAFEISVGHSLKFDGSKYISI